MVDGHNLHLDGDLHSRLRNFSSLSSLTMEFSLNIGRTSPNSGSQLDRVAHKIQEKHTIYPFRWWAYQQIYE